MSTIVSPDELRKLMSDGWSWRGSGGSGYKLKDFSYFCQDGRRIEDVLKLDLSEGVDFSYMCAGLTIQQANSLTESDVFENTGKGEKFDYMFSGVNTNEGNSLHFLSVGYPYWPINTSNGRSFEGMFKNCNRYDGGDLDLSNGTNFKDMYNGCSDMGDVNTGAAGASELSDLRNGINFNGMFRGCSNIWYVGYINLANGEDLGSMFSGCTSLRSMFTDPGIKNAKIMGSMFYNCSNLKVSPELDAPSCTNFYNIFRGCTALTTVPKMNLNSATNVNTMFYGCTNLTNLYVYNVRKAITIGSGTTYGHLLTVDSLVHTIKELCTVTTATKLTMGEANLEKISGLYCRVLDDTTEKIEMELCESTDEGAITLADYALLKNWTFA